MLTMYSNKNITATSIQSKRILLNTRCIMIYISINKLQVIQSHSKSLIIHDEEFFQSYCSIMYYSYISKHKISATTIVPNNKCIR